ncbi:MAG: hypothetical protein QOI20_2674 [Acidimicrobiaceae bacterium]|jgi:hypothetical protein|nr:hypothetical protein [Acidimicrobiaceae bacterium]
MRHRAGRARIGALAVLGLLMAASPAAQAKWSSPPHDPPPPGGKLGLIQAYQAGLDVGGPSGSTAPANVGPGRRGLALPANSGLGRRAVYSNSMQHVWVVEGDGRVIRDYPVSGRRGLPNPGTYHVYSRSRVSRSGSLALNYMVRFATGRSLAIGFHEIPARPGGSHIQSDAQLGTPLSHGCVRQSAIDAAFMWDWGQMGTTVVVLP